MAIVRVSAMTFVAAPIIWFIASETADSSMSERPSPIGSGIPIIRAASFEACSGERTKRLLPVTPET